MRIAFEATEASFDANEYALVCGAYGGEYYLVFQRDAEESEEDWGVHLEYADQINGDYGCVQACRLNRAVLSVDLARQLGRLTGVVGFDVALCIDDESYSTLRAGLQQVFRNMPGVLQVL